MPGTGVVVALTAGVGTGVPNGTALGTKGVRAGTGVAETAGALFRIGAAVGAGTLGMVWLSGTLLGCTLIAGLAAGTVVVRLWPVVLVCAETNDSVIT
jgi:hypothetical protein